MDRGVRTQERNEVQQPSEVVAEQVVGCRVPPNPVAPSSLSGQNGDYPQPVATRHRLVEFLHPFPCSVEVELKR